MTSTTDVAVRDDQAGALEHRAADRINRSVLSRDVVDVLKAQIVRGGDLVVTDAELANLFVQSAERGLSLLNGQMWAVPRRQKVNGQWVNTLAHQTGIAGLRLIAERTGQYGGRLSVEWCGDDGEWRDVWPDSKGDPMAARVVIRRNDQQHPTVGVAYWSESVQTNRDGEPNEMWKRRGRSQLAKCAEAAALRAAFSEELAGVEWSQADGPDEGALAMARQALMSPEDLARNRWDRIKLAAQRAGLVEPEQIATALERAGLGRPTMAVLSDETARGGMLFDQMVAALDALAPRPDADQAGEATGQPDGDDDDAIEGEAVEDDGPQSVEGTTEPDRNLEADPEPEPEPAVQQHTDPLEQAKARAEQAMAAQWRGDPDDPQPAGDPDAPQGQEGIPGV